MLKILAVSQGTRCLRDFTRLARRAATATTFVRYTSFHVHPCSVRRKRRRLTKEDMADSFEETVKINHGDGRDKRGAGGRRGGGRGGRGRGGGGGANRDMLLSKALSKLLRHQAVSAGIQLDREGYAALDKVMQYPPIRSLQPTFSEIRSAVRDSDKQRFALKPKDPADDTSDDPADWLIRANQGHSIKVDSEALLRPIAILPKDADEGGSGGNGHQPQAGSPTADQGRAEGGGGGGEEEGGKDGPRLSPVPVPETVVHGTYFAFWPAIVSSGGLKRMSRTHVHCSTGLPPQETGSSDASSPAVVSGMRKDAELLVYIDVERSIREAGMKWWVSENGVVLTEGIDEGGQEGLVPARFFKEVVGRKKDVGVLWRDGRWVADMPEGLKVVVPVGKGGRGWGGRGRGGRRAGGRGGRGGMEV